MAVPSMLLAYGSRCALGPRPGAGEPRVQIATIVGLKLVLHRWSRTWSAATWSACTASNLFRGHGHRRPADGAERLHPRGALRQGGDLGPGLHLHLHTSARCR
jgi:hypothetical protein